MMVRTPTYKNNNKIIIKYYKNNLKEHKFANIEDFMLFL
jgi:hypothetical protein